MKGIESFLKPLFLAGGAQLPNRIIPGPMEGIMSPVFCRAMHELELLDCWMTPFIRISNSVPGGKRLKSRIEPFLESGLPVIVQLLGDNPELLAETAARLLSFKIAGINMNFACPSKSVIGKRGGGALLRSPGKMNAILKAMRKECPGASLSVKIRSGFDLPLEMKEIIPALCEVDIDFIAIHFRTVKEEYLPVTDGYERLRVAKELAGDIPVIGSGDVFDIEDALSMREIAGVDGIMAARGLLKNPWLIRDIQRGKRSFDQEERRIHFFKVLLEIARGDPERCWRRSAFMELARNLWGEEDEFFRKVRKLSDNELLTGKMESWQ
jgi:tRNA-dihydrouridine synthase C